MFFYCIGEGEQHKKEQHKGEERITKKENDVNKGTKKLKVMKDGRFHQMEKVTKPRERFEEEKV